ncbi:hypothetical protein WICMUC_003726 [Wickerhamomyces mucosus]|uniref:Uncharacterized protein n=1 Tax=Wickerhamomyces mucosus TaxID=1378264 RepID=A0A9P8PK28_9ASCO|nr:hypothetical protein WICMUC_003726 [Wickerhamomyces mucosus]
MKFEVKAQAKNPRPKTIIALAPIGSINEFKIIPKVSALTLALPACTLGSLFIHLSQSKHNSSNADTLVSGSQRFSTYDLVHLETSNAISIAYSSIFKLISDLTVSIALINT